MYFGVIFATGTSDCQQLFAKLRKAVQAVSDIALSLNIYLYVVECKSIEQAKPFHVRFHIFLFKI